jgi:hypothetical protein
MKSAICAAYLVALITRSQTHPKPPCPEPWPQSNFTDEDLAALEAEAEKQDRADGKGALYDRKLHHK